MSIGTYEGSHVFIFDSYEKPIAVVLAWNPSMKHTTTPGFGKRRGYEFDEAARLYTRQQTGLEVPDLEIVGEWDNDGQPFDEKAGVRQLVKIITYVARRTIPENVELALATHRQTENGKIYQPRLVPIDEIRKMQDRSEELPNVVVRYLQKRRKA